MRDTLVVKLSGVFVLLSMAAEIGAIGGPADVLVIDRIDRPDPD